jgi:dTDP-4-amino-4,6-dideoxygalactose transaminase
VDEFIEVNYRNYRAYQRELANIPGLKLFHHNEGEHHNYQYIVVEVDRRAASLTRDHLVTVLSAENILARRYFYPGCHRVEPYRSRVPQARARLPRTEKLSDRVLTLPTGTAVGPEDIQVIGQIIRLAVTHGAEVTALMDKSGERQPALASRRRKAGQGVRQRPAGRS